MSILGGRLAGKEAAFFFEESKRAVTRLADTIPNKASPPPTTTTSAAPTAAESADVLPEVLRHSLPAKFFRQERLSDSPAPLSTGSSKWTIRSPRNSDTQFSSVSRDSLDPLRGYISLPQVTLGPKRWQLPSADSSVLASTANELRRDQYTQANPEKLRAVAEGLSQIGKAFAAATAIVFGGAALVVSKLDLQNIDDIRSKGRDLVQPKFDTIKERLSPMRDWAEKTSKKWRIKNEHEIKEKPMIKKLSKTLGVKTST